MRQKSGKATIIIGVITLIVIAFILFSTLYDQIIAQNEGFFYMLIFGGILVLVFVLINLITKLTFFQHISILISQFSLALALNFFYNLVKNNTNFFFSKSFLYIHKC